MRPPSPAPRWPPRGSLSQRCRPCPTPCFSHTPSPLWLPGVPVCPGSLLLRPYLSLSLSPSHPQTHTRPFWSPGLKSGNKSVFAWTAAGRPWRRLSPANPPDCRPLTLLDSVLSWEALGFIGSSPPLSIQAWMGTQRNHQRSKEEPPGDSDHQPWIECFQETQGVGSEFSQVLRFVPAPTQTSNSGRFSRIWNVLTGIKIETLSVILRQ